MNRKNVNLPGRGRGYRKAPAQARPPLKVKKIGYSITNKLTDAQKRFEEASQKHQHDAKQVLDKQSTTVNYESSEEEEDLDDKLIVSKLTAVYQGINIDQKDVTETLKLTSQYLTECCQSGALTCLVCISSIKRIDQVWNCKKCYSCFHLACIRKWVTEGVTKSSLLSDEYFPKKDRPWYCPKCRNEYQREDCPSKYVCFCTKVENPEYDPWILPHSCGEVCDRLLENPSCSHRCVLLCHPGPCPPCPKTVMVSCHCGKSPPTMRRCGTGKQSCGQKCEKPLLCGSHRCQDICHEGDCPPCSYTSHKRCLCGKNGRLQPCAESTWCCEIRCNKPLACGFHNCTKGCHADGDCSKCPHESNMRTCPCGKEVYTDLQCIDVAPICQDTCMKELNCYGNHKCTRRCHHGDCDSCLMVVSKSCRCGKRKKDVTCQKEFLCDLKCNRLKSCGMHRCKRKCCDGNCPPCDKTCGRALQCRRHKCQLICHPGGCYPCVVTSKVTCNCGKSSINVLCGQRRALRPPRCRLLCTKPTNCHHPTQVPHNCHFDDCPPCRQICDLTLSCGHHCPDSCHDNVRSEKALRPWEPVTTQIIKQPCSPCRVPTSVVCFGGHDSFVFECHEAKEHSCGRKCGRLLKCGNHSCELLCHVVESAADEYQAGSNCQPCESECLKPRPHGCVHDCPLPCHQEDCPPCKKRLRRRCYCKSVLMKFHCDEWTSVSEEQRIKIQSCGNQCPNLLQTCGHPCPLTCHPGECPTSEECLKKVVLRCKCKRLKKAFICKNLQKDREVIKCDETCKQIKRTKFLESKKSEIVTTKNTSEAEVIHRKTRNDTKPNTTSKTSASRSSKNKISFRSLKPFLLAFLGTTAGVLVIVLLYFLYP